MRTINSKVYIIIDTLITNIYTCVDDINMVYVQVLCWYFAISIFGLQADSCKYVHKHTQINY